MAVDERGWGSLALGDVGGDLAQFDAVRLYYGPGGNGAGGAGDMVLEADLP